jgi:plastocyanin
MLLSKHAAAWRLIPAFLVAIVLASPLRAEEAAAASSPSPTTVHIDNFTFSPAEITVVRGTTVVWVNGDDIPHTVVATNKAFRSKVLDTEQQFSFTFKDSGSYEYFCSLHPHMKGKVVVK